ncbi:MAG: AlpA family phage regulatory protein [Nitrospinae bacterium]|nr:AlpA family phage regulatory protein [Nitrospinota bacterium]
MALHYKPAVRKRTGFSDTTLWRRIKAGDFPKPKQVSPNKVAWTDIQLDTWEESLPEALCELPENLTGGPAASVKKRLEGSRE